jgi:hypothetical protein
MEETKELTPEEKRKQYIRERYAKNKARVQEQQELYRDRVAERRARNDAIGAYGY